MIDKMRIQIDKKYIFVDNLICKYAEPSSGQEDPSDL